MSRRALYITLFVSLALNLFVLGALAGVWLGERRPPHAEQPGPRMGGPIGAAVRTLSPEHRAAWRDGGEALARETGQRMREARRMRREALQALGAEPLDREAALARLTAAREAEGEARSGMDRRLVDFAASLPAAERARFAEALAAPRGERSGGGRAEGRPALSDR